MRLYFIKNKTKIFRLLYCLVISFLVLMICSKNSFLYPFNNWVDENAFFTVGKAWGHGLIPYRDLFEQKGPVLFLIFTLSSFISSRTFIGVFIFEIISFTIFLYYVIKIINLFINKNLTYLFLPLIAVFITSSSFFAHGGSAEEFCLPLLMYTFYSFLKVFVCDNDISYKNLFINGLIAGVILLIKFTILGFWFGFMASLFFYFIINKKYKKAFISCLVFLSGMFIPMLVFSLYFLLVGGFREFIDVYFKFNIFNYSGSQPVLSRIKQAFSIFYREMSVSFVYLSLIYVGFLYFIFSNNFIKNKVHKLFVVAFIGFGILGVFWGCKEFVYYFLMIMSFVILGFIMIGNYITNEVKLDTMKYCFIGGIILVLSVHYIGNSSNIEYMKNKKSDIVQYKFAKIIHKNEGKTLLNYGAIDGGFYMAANIIPNVKYFESINANVPGMDEFLEKKIKKRSFDYIVIRTYPGYNPINDNIKDNYDKVSVGKEINEGMEFKYYLYERKGM